MQLRAGLPLKPAHFLDEFRTLSNDSGQFCAFTRYLE
jgi:hypothetical protein